MNDMPKRRGRPPKAAKTEVPEPVAASAAPQAEKVECEVLRDFWPEEGHRVRKGTVISLDPMDAIAGIEIGAFRRVSK